jgi:acyl dehydratase
MISGVSRTYDELEVDAVYRSRFGRTVLEADNVWFTLLTMNTNPVHSDAANGGRSQRGRRFPKRLNGPFGPFSPQPKWRRRESNPRP